jgi:putative DNA primase/helicase
MIDDVTRSKLSYSQVTELEALAKGGTDIDVTQLAKLIADEVFDRGLVVPALAEAVQIIGPMECDEGKNIWHYSEGVWLPDGHDELNRRVQLCTGRKYRKEYVGQVASVITSRPAVIVGIGSPTYFNVRNGMLEWETLKLHPHSPTHHSTYQLNMNWNPEATCPAIDNWFNESFDPTLHELLWQIIGVTWHPGEGFQKAITLIGSGYNGKGTFLRLCEAGLPSFAYASVDPKRLADNRFASAELFGKTANIVGDIERFTINSTAEFKKITGHDQMRAERKMGHAFYFKSKATNLFAGNKMPPSRDTSVGWIRRWLIIPMEKTITGKPDPGLEPQLHKELEGALVKAVHGLRDAMAKGGFLEPPIVLDAQKKYEYACNSSALFINEQLKFGDSWTHPMTRAELLDKYESFCRVRKLDPDSRNKFYEMLKELGSPHLKEHWDGSLRGFTGLSCSWY